MHILESFFKSRLHGNIQFNIQQMRGILLTTGWEVHSICLLPLWLPRETRRNPGLHRLTANHRAEHCLPAPKRYLLALIYFLKGMTMFNTKFHKILCPPNPSQTLLSSNSSAWKPLLNSLCSWARANYLPKAFKGDRIRVQFKRSKSCLWYPD